MASRRPLRLQYRIVLPLVLVALASTGVATWVGVRVTSNALRTRLETQLRNSVSAVTWRDFASNPLILKSLSAVVGADVVTLGPSGEVVATSMDVADNPTVVAARGAVSRLPPTREPRVTDADCGFPCVVAYREVDERPGTVVALVADVSPLAAATRAIAATMLVAAALSVVVLVLASQIVVRRVTAPLERLVHFVQTREPDPGLGRAPVGGDEIGSLAQAFNDMLDRLDESRAALVRSEKLGLAGLFAARVAHDVRNPLSSIRMQTQLLQSKGVADPDDRDALAAMLRDVDQVESVVRDLMEMANPGELRLTEADLNAVVREALAHVSHQFDYRGIVVSLELADVPPVALDRPRFKQAVLNVLVNGSEAMPTGGTLSVSTFVEGTAGVLRICDDGVGIAPDMLANVFDPFVTTKPDGVGLGLVNVKAVVVGHGGRIHLAPRSPRGTCATIHIPLHDRG